MEEFSLDLKTALHMHCDYCKVLSKCEHYEGSIYICIDREVCKERQTHPLVIRAKELGIKLCHCSHKDCSKLVGYTNFASMDRKLVITQGVCKWHQIGLVGFNYKRPIPHGTERGYRLGCKEPCCLSAHAEKLSGDRSIAGSLKRIPETHEIEGILVKCKDKNYMPSDAELYAFKTYMEQFPRYFIDNYLDGVAPAVGDDLEDDSPADLQGGSSEDSPGANGV